MANPDDKTKDTTQLSKQESIAKKTYKVNSFLLSVQIESFYWFQEEKKTGVPIFQYGERYERHENYF